MRLTIGEDCYSIEWQYDPVEIPVKSYGLMGSIVSYFTTIKTTCTITKNNAPILQYHCVCSLGDQFRKETGRKISLTRALLSRTAEHHGFDKALRTEIWRTYHNRKRMESLKKLATQAQELGMGY